MKKYVVRRLLLLIPILFGITFLSFAMMRIAGSDVVLQRAEASGVTLTPEVIAAQRTELGLDQPFLVQYFRWLGGFLTGDLGTSYVSGNDVFETFLSKLPATLLLTGTSVLLTVVISVPLGILSAVKQNRLTDDLIRFCSFIGNSLPNFFVALVLMYVFSIRFPVFPVISSGVSLQSAVLPTLTLAIAMSAKYLRQVRAAVLDELNKEYVTGARARGVRFCRDALEECPPRLPGYDSHAAGLIGGESSRRDGDCGIHLYVGRRGQTGGGCHKYERLSDDPGVCGLDGADLRYCKSDHGSFLSDAGSEDPAGR